MFVMYVRRDRDGETELEFIASRESRDTLLSECLELVEPGEYWEIAHVVNSGIGQQVGG